MMLPRVILFDVDDTLAESFQPPKPGMMEHLLRLLELRPIGILSAAGFARIERDFLAPVEKSSHTDRFYVFSDGTSRCTAYRGGAWRELYRVAFSEAERTTIVQAVERAVAQSHIEFNTKYDPLIVNQESKVAYAALGLKATEEDKLSWDPDRSKREKLRSILQGMLPQFEVVIGGKTTIDIFPKGINKAYGIRWLSKELGIPPNDMLYVADAFYPGGNDEVAIPTGIQTRPVKNPQETLQVIDDLLKMSN